MQKTEIINVRLPKEILKQIDIIVEKNLYATRSEVIRHFLREYAEEKRRKNK